uniref:Uncharacterized protein n=1 Tax=Anopheles dirus TaxID=7168 RepID=A0A182NH73_9DIPT
MKFIILLALFGAAFGQNLRAEVDQLLPFLNMEQVRSIYQRYVQTDAQVGEIWSFLQSAETDAAWRVLISTPELQEISAWTEFGELYRMTQARRAGFTSIIQHPDVTRFSAQLRAFGVDVDQIIARFQAFFGWN